MRFAPSLAAALALAITPGVAGAGGRGGGGHSSGSHSSHRSSGGSAHPAHHSSSRGSGTHGSTGPSKKALHTTHGSGSHKAVGVQRNSHGKIKRDPEQRARFMLTHPCPSTGKTSGACPGYVVDHVHALKHGGRDDPSNMQWQTKQAAKAKDKWE